ncbi:hypothetical protein V2W45_1255983, partial [Cenococcum geophilum]
TAESQGSATADVSSFNPLLTILPVIPINTLTLTPSASTTDARFSPTPKNFPKGSVGILTGAMFAVVLVSLGAILACRSGRQRERPKSNIKEQQEREQDYLQVLQTSSPQLRARPQSQPWEMDARNRGKSVVELEGDEAYRAVESADMR